MQPLPLQPGSFYAPRQPPLELAGNQNLQLWAFLVENYQMELDRCYIHPISYEQTNEKV